MVRSDYRNLELKSPIEECLSSSSTLINDVTTEILPLTTASIIQPSSISNFGVPVVELYSKEMMDSEGLLDIKNELQYPSLAHSLGALGGPSVEQATSHEDLLDHEPSSSPRISSSANNSTKNRRRNVKRQEKPPFSYIALIAMAIHKRPDRKATLAEIYTYLQDNFDFFRGEYVGWRNSIRHNLSLNECFVKLPKDAGERGRKGHKWTISDNCEFLYEEGAFRRRPRGYKTRNKRPTFNGYEQFEYTSTPTSAVVPSTDYGVDKTHLDVQPSSVNVSLTSPSMGLSMAVPYANGYLSCPSLASTAVWNPSVTSSTASYEAWYGYGSNENMPIGYVYQPETSSTIMNNAYDEWQLHSTPELSYSAQPQDTMYSH
ncbi:unnamed protein product [Auanema sp. JU1783]|nr:unnamed protein product [Auanema sp. JU1783]